MHRPALFPPLRLFPSTITIQYTRMKPTGSVMRYIHIRRGLKLGLCFTVCHRLSMLVIAVNLIVILDGLLERDLSQQPRRCLAGVAANVTAAVLIRQDHVINVLFWTIGQLPHRTPLWLRKHAAKLYHLGGTHNGAGVAAGIWYLLFNVAAVNQRPQNMPLHAEVVATVALCTLMDILFLQILVFSVPKIGTKFHNLWKQMHRFLGWLLLASFWAFLFMYNIANRGRPPDHR